MNQRVVFSEARIAKLPAPAKGRITIYDAKTPGLAVRVTATGNRSFCWYRKLAGRPVRMTIGTWPTITVDVARKQVAKWAARVAGGEDPQADRQARRSELTLADLWQHWEGYSQGHKRTWREDERMYKTFLAKWAKRPLSKIRTTDVQAIHNRIAADSGKYQANRVFELLRAMYNKADEIGYRGENPAAGIKRFREDKRDRFLRADELKAFFDSLAAEHNELLRDFFLTALLTGARRRNVQTMRWSDLDLQAGFWRIDAEDAKAGKTLLIPLTTPVLAVLRGRRAAVDTGEWVFPSRGKTGHIVEPKSAWKRIIRRAGLVDVRPHDLRRSLGSWMAMTGAGLPVVGKMLGHTQPAATMVYARLDSDPVRRAAETAADAMLDAGGAAARALIFNGNEVQYG